MPDQVQPPPPVNVLLEGDSIVQLLETNEGNLLALTSFGFILKCDASAWIWHQVPAPIDLKLAKLLQESPEAANGAQET